MSRQQPRLTVEEVLKATGGRLIAGKRDGVFLGVSTDSRAISPQNLFVALEGEKFDGHDFLTEVADKGVAGVIVQRDIPELSRESLAVVLVEDTLRALGDIAHFWRNRFHMPVVAITGSAGKTTTKEMLAGILEQTGDVLKTEGNLNNLIGLPLTLMRMESRHAVAIVELGTNQPGEIGRLTRIAKPNMGLITNVGLAHLEGLKSLDVIREEKGALFQNMADTATALINVDDEAVRKLGRRWKGRRITFGLKGRADVTARNLKKAGVGDVQFDLVAGSSAGSVTMNVLGEHHVYNALAASASAWALGVGHSVICRGLSLFRPVSGRMEIRQLANGAYVINDTYNANPSSMMEALKSLKDLRGYGRSVVILGDMLELGRRSKKLHEVIGECLAETGVDRVFLKGDFALSTAAGAVRKGMPGNAVVIYNAGREITDYLHSYLREGDWVLVKGSRRMKMEQAVEEIVQIFGLKDGPHRNTVQDADGAMKAKRGLS